MAFCIWVFFGLMFVLLGIYCYLTRRPTAFGFWANAKVFPVKDVRAYNRALGKLWVCFGLLFSLLGLGLRGGQNSAGPVITILGTLVLAIGTMVVYVTVIEKKYRREQGDSEFHD